MDIRLPPDLRISTITATSKINSDIDIEGVYNSIDVDKTFKYVEFANRPNKGVSQKTISDKKRATKKVFFNQITVEICSNNVTNNIKLFNNGSISMTGVKDIETGQKSVNILFDYLKNKNISVFKTQDPKISFFKIVLINSDFKINYEIKRSELHQLLVNDMKIYSSYEPCIYPGVNSKYFWNKEYTVFRASAIDCFEYDDFIGVKFDVLMADINTNFLVELYSDSTKEVYLNKFVPYTKFPIDQKNISFDSHDNYLSVKFNVYNMSKEYISSLLVFLKELMLNKKLDCEIDYKYKGSCYCSGVCSGKGSGDGEIQCKKVTISAFQSGSIIITGANNLTQMVDCYNFINQVIETNSDILRKNSIEQDGTTIYIKKSSIIY
jgi:TATA-box binding protein (TBP) (component of TFIID and TFIIIB)